MRALAFLIILGGMGGAFAIIGIEAIITGHDLGAALMLLAPPK